MGVRDDTATTTPRRRERMKFHSIRAPSSRRPSSSRTRRPRAAVDANRAFDPTMRCDAMRCDAMRCDAYLSPYRRRASRARSRTRAPRSSSRSSTRASPSGTPPARESRDGLARARRPTSAGPPPEPSGRGRGIDRSSDRPSVSDNREGVYTVDVRMGSSIISHTIYFDKVVFRTIERTLPGP